MLQFVSLFKNVLIEFINSNYEYSFIDNIIFDFVNILIQLLETFYTTLSQNFYTTT